MISRLYEMHARMCRVFTSPKRLEILNILRGGECSVNDIVKYAGINQSNVSQHLGVLKEEGIVKTRRSGVRIYYSLANQRILEAFDIIRDVLFEKLACDEKFSKDMRRIKEVKDGGVSKKIKGKGRL